MFPAANVLLRGLLHQVAVRSCRSCVRLSSSVSCQVQPESDLLNLRLPEVQQYEPSQQHINIKQIIKKFALTPVEYTVDDFSSVIDDENSAKKVHLIILELETLRMSSGQAPCVLSTNDMQCLMQCRTKSSRARLLLHFYRWEKRKANIKVTKEIRRLQLEAQPKQPTKALDSIYPVIRKQQELLFFNSRLAAAAQFGQKLVVDCGFEDHINQKEMSSLVRQLQLAYSLNKTCRDPFDLILSDIVKGGELDQKIERHFPNSNASNFLVTRNYDSYLAMFPKERILYLTPNSPNVITEWDPDAVVIIGGLTQKADGRPLTMAKAKQQQVRHGKLPVGLYLPMFRANTSMSLSLLSVVELLTALRETNDWSHAFSKMRNSLAGDFEKNQNLQINKKGYPYGLTMHEAE